MIFWKRLGNQDMVIICRYLFLVTVAIGCFAIPFQQVERRGKREIVENVCSSCGPGYQCCHDPDRCDMKDCEKCYDGMFSPGGTAICQNCASCLIGTTVIKACTIATDTECSNCTEGSYLSSAGICRLCSKCNGDLACKDICVTASPPPAVTTTTVAPVINVQSTIGLTTKEVEKTIVRGTSKAPVVDTPESNWKNIYLIPIFLSPVMILAIIGFVTKVFCCWTQHSKDFWKAYCPCCCTSHKQSSEGGPLAVIKNATNVFIGKETDGASSSSGPKRTYIPVSTTDETDGAPSTSDMPNDSLNSSSSKRRPVMDIPSQQKITLPRSCLSDGTRVSIEDITLVSNFIGKEGIRLAANLYLKDGEIENIEGRYPTDLQLRNFELLKLWMNQKGVHATKKALASALNCVGRPQIALDYLWRDGVPNSVSPTSPKELTFWQRRFSFGSESGFKLDTRMLKSANFLQQKTWQKITRHVIENEKNCGDFNELKVACGMMETVIQDKAKLKPVEGCSIFKAGSESLVDNTAISLLNETFKHLTPVVVPENGNCLFAAASILFYGSPDHYAEIRLRTVIELGSHRDHYIESNELVEFMKAEYQLTTLGEDDFLSDQEEIEFRFERCVRDTLKEPEVLSLQGNSVQMFGLASVLQCNIQSVYPVKVGESSPLNVLIKPRDRKIEKPPTVFIMWSMHKKDSEFLPNHFVPLLKKPHEVVTSI